MFIKLLVNGFVIGKTYRVNLGWYQKNMYGNVLSVFHDFPLDQSNDQWVEREMIQMDLRELDVDAGSHSHFSQPIPKW